MLYKAKAAGRNRVEYSSSRMRCGPAIAYFSRPREQLAEAGAMRQRIEQMMRHNHAGLLLTCA